MLRSALSRVSRRWAGGGAASSPGCAQGAARPQASRQRALGRGGEVCGQCALLQCMPVTVGVGVAAGSLTCHLGVQVPMQGQAGCDCKGRRQPGDAGAEKRPALQPCCHPCNAWSCTCLRRRDLLTQRSHAGGASAATERSRGCAGLCYRRRATSVGKGAAVTARRHHVSRRHP